MLFWNENKINTRLDNHIDDLFRKEWANYCEEMKTGNAYFEEKTKCYKELYELDLNRRLEDVYEEIDNKFKRLEKLERIIKYLRDDKPAFNLVQRIKSRYINYRYEEKLCDLYLYIDKEEYKINLAEIAGMETDNNNCSVDVKDNLAYFNVVISNEDTWKEYKFIIDYKNEKYILSEEIDMCKPSKM